MGKPGSILTVTDLTKYGFSYPDCFEHRLISRVLTGWKAFLKTPPFYKKWWVDPKAVDSSLGYQVFGRQDEDIEVFNAKSNLRKTIEKNDFDFKQYEQWVADLDLLREHCTDYCLNITQALCEHLGQDYLALEKSFKADQENILQLVKYPYDKFNLLIEPHQDKSFLSMLLYENFSGFLFGKKVNAHHIRQEGRAFVYFGEQAENFSPKLRAMTHGIKNNSTKKSLSLSFSLISSSLQEKII